MLPPSHKEKNAIFFGKLWTFCESAKKDENGRDTLFTPQLSKSKMFDRNGVLQTRLFSSFRSPDVHCLEAVFFDV